MREFTQQDKQYKYYSSGGSYYLEQWIDSKNYNKIIVPKSDTNFCKECSDEELATYFIERIISHRELKIKTREKETTEPLKGRIK